MALPKQKIVPDRVRPTGNFFMLPNQRIDSLTDQEAFDLCRTRGSQTVGGRDPVHLSLERIWFTNVAYYIGLQRVEAGELEHLVDPNFVMPESPYVANHIQRIVMGQVSRLSKSRPHCDTIPKSPDIEDQIGAKVGAHFLAHYDDVFKFERMRMQGAFWGAICGTHFLYADWNKSGGEKSKVYQNPFDQSLMHEEQVEPQQRAWLEQIGAAAEIASGQIDARILSGFNVFVPPGYDDINLMPWIVIEDDRSIDWLWDNYPDKAHLITPDELDTTPEAQYKRRIASLVGRHGFAMPGRADDYSELIRTRTMWIPPSGRMPEGRKIVITRSMVLENDVHPYAKAGLKTRYPIFPAPYAPVPGRFWGMGLVEHLLGPQRDYNRARHQVMTMRDILATPQWIAPKGSELTTQNNDYGVIWEYRAGFGKPELQPPPPMSPMHEETIERAIYDMQKISAQSEASQGDVPTGVRSGVALRALQEKDLSVLDVPVLYMESAWQEFSEHLLNLTWKFVKTPQMIHIYGESRQADVSIFKGSDLNGNTKVRVRPGSMQPRNKSETMQLLMDLVQNGTLNPAMNPRHSRIVLKAMELGGTDKLFEEEDADRRRANIENQMFLKPVVDNVTQQMQPFPDVNDDDDHQAHMEEHLLFKKTDGFERLPPMRKMAFEAHLAKHKEAIAQLLQAQMLIAGGAGGGGGGSPPRETGKPSPPKESGGGDAPGGSM